MNFKHFHCKLSFFVFLLSANFTLFAQTTVVTGTVTDASDNKPLPFVTVSFRGTANGVTTDSRGKYSISTDKSYTQLKMSSLGYKNAFVAIAPGKEQVLNVKLFPVTTQLNEVEVNSGKKQKYRNKDNPAVELIRKVIENKEKNRPENYSFVEYREYDKVQFSLSNLRDKVSDKNPSTNTNSSLTTATPLLCRVNRCCPFF